ncbi:MULTISPECIES: rhodanese-like domain-containing protein [Anaerococcus]|jgi:rhodanese domain protein|uniref:rhodanese-like domain-containing protein n=1 Tax=Anaerococcus TaxID=165779 RepID=UPI001AE37807|nr:MULTISPECIES: rhodanese-like domain-containing protein [Anaerococcus]MBP2069384.1 rhodanese-related sulfurtransferase [Anaerococcus nagyae]MDU1829333.1 rhodanese-like domain-containing protein [Anaerococcus sp.]MDU1864248.1 rhodanese-like domain-containing protein [Anaerococcus sp.]MDU2566436.1 rhodanese-like domain-containing protein [Anaerococcus sp.]MDU3211590.1 rhodanese-like domain-containing protein [Anaerococcus sp.]
MYFKQIEGKDLEENLEYFNVLDVRTKEEFDNGHIKNAIHIPYDEVIKRKDEIPLDKPLVIHCRTNNRSEFAATMLMYEGFSDIIIAPGVELYDYKLEK